MQNAYKINTHQKKEISIHAKNINNSKFINLFLKYKLYQFY